MEQKKKKYARGHYENLIKVTNENRKYYWGRWFGDEKEKKAHKNLENAEIPVDLKNEVKLTNHIHSMDAISQTEYALTDSSSDEIYYVAYTEVGEDNLEMVILYAYLKHVGTIHVVYMGIAAQAVWFAVREGLQERTREPIYGLFKNTLCQIKEELGDAVQKVHIYIASRGSANAVNHVWKTNASENEGDMELDITTICAQCGDVGAQMHLTGVGIQFCNAKCANDLWSHWLQLGHPISKRFRFNNNKK